MVSQAGIKLRFVDSIIVTYFDGVNCHRQNAAEINSVIMVLYKAADRSYVFGRVFL